MDSFVLKASIAGWELLCYVALIYIMLCRHRPPRTSTYKLLVVFSIIRIISCSAQIATTATGSDISQTVAIAAGFFSLSPLLLAAHDILSRVYFSMHRVPLNNPAVLCVVLFAQLPIITALILCIVGVASTSTSADITNQNHSMGGGMIFYLTDFAIIAILTILTGARRYITHYRDEITLFHALAASIPLLLLRLIYSILLVFSDEFISLVAKVTLASFFTELFMERVVEMTVVLLFLYASLSQRGHDMRENEEKLAMAV